MLQTRHRWDGKFSSIQGGVHDFRPQTQTPNDTFRCQYLSTVVSSLMEAGAVKDLKDLSKRVHCFHKFLYLGGVLSRLVVDIQSGVIGLLQCVNPREELSQSRDTPISTLQPLLPVS